MAAPMDVEPSTLAASSSSSTNDNHRDGNNAAATTTATTTASPATWSPSERKEATARVVQRLVTGARGCVEFQHKPRAWLVQLVQTHGDTATGDDDSTIYQRLERLLHRHFATAHAREKFPLIRRKALTALYGLTRSINTAVDDMQAAAITTTTAPPQASTKPAPPSTTTTTNGQHGAASAVTGRMGSTSADVARPALTAAKSGGGAQGTSVARPAVAAARAPESAAPSDTPAPQPFARAPPPTGRPHTTTTTNGTSEALPPKSTSQAPQRPASERPSYHNATADKPGNSQEPAPRRRPSEDRTHRGASEERGRRHPSEERGRRYPSEERGRRERSEERGRRERSEEQILRRTSSREDAPPTAWSRESLEGQQSWKPNGGDNPSTPSRDKYKIALCKNFAKGSCRFGQNCHFAHGMEELERRKAQLERETLTHHPPTPEDTNGAGAGPIPLSSPRDVEKMSFAELKEELWKRYNFDVVYFPPNNREAEARAELARRRGLASGQRQPSNEPPAATKDASVDISVKRVSQQKMRHFLSEINESGVHLTGYVNNLLSLSTIPQTRTSFLSACERFPTPKAQNRMSFYEKVWGIVAEKAAKFVSESNSRRARSSSPAAGDGRGSRTNPMVNRQPSSSVTSSSQSTTAATGMRNPPAPAPASAPKSKERSVALLARRNFEALGQPPPGTMTRMNMREDTQHHYACFANDHIPGGRPRMSVMFTPRIMSLTDLHSAIDRIYHWEPFWSLDWVVSATITTSSTQPNHVLAKTAGQLDVHLHDLRNSETVRRTQQIKASDWGRQSTSPFKTNDTRLLLLALPLKPYAKKRADTHLWPKGTFLQMTKRGVQQPIRISQRKQQTHDEKEWKEMCRVLDMTEQIKEPKEPFKLEIVCYDPEPYFFCLGFFRHRTEQSIYDMLMTPGSENSIEKLSLEEARKKALDLTTSKIVVLDDDEDDGSGGEEAGKMIFAITDLNSQKVVKSPVRGRFCAHFQCFDLQSFLAVNKHVSGQRWRCTLCDKFCSWQQLQYCGLTASLASEFGGDVSANHDRIEFRSDGSYCLLDERPARGGSKKRKADSGPNPQESGAAPKQQKRPAEEEVVEIE